MFLRQLPNSIARRVSATSLVPVASRAQLTTTSLAQLGALGGERCTDPAAATYRAWHVAVDDAMKGGVAGLPLLRPHVHDECVFRPPTYYAPWVGGDETLLLLSGTMVFVTDMKRVSSSVPFDPPSVFGGGGGGGGDDVHGSGNQI